MKYPKLGTLRSTVFLAYARKQNCQNCRAPAPSDPHHFPPKGMGGGAVRDDLVTALCRRCHDNAQQYQEGFTVDYQHRLVDEMRSRFMEWANDLEWEAFNRDRARWAESRGTDDLVPM